MVNQSKDGSVKKRGKKGTSRPSSTKSSASPPELGKNPFSQEEVLRLINSTESLEDRTLLLLGFNTGMKASEIISLEPINFEFANGIVKIWDRKGKYYRAVCITDELINEIRLFIDTRKESVGPKLFPFTSKTVEGRFQKHTLKTLGESRTWESLRRTYISMAAKLDYPIWMVINSTGESPSTIVKYYMEYPIANARRKVNELPLYPDSPKITIKTDELKSILERPYVEKMNQIISDRAKLRQAISEFRVESP